MFAKRWQLCCAVVFCGLWFCEALNVVQIGDDPYTNSEGQHKTNVEPDIAAFGNTIVGVYQVGRQTVGATNIGWSTSTDAGKTWKNGYLNGTTIWAGGSWSFITDPSVDFDLYHKVWIITAMTSDQSGNWGMVSFNSPDALHWSSSYNIYNQDPESDKDMIQCDKWPNSPYFGHCYVEWDSGTAYIQTTTDGGQTWSAPQTADDLEGIGGEPQVLPNGVVCVPINAGFDGTISAMMSSDGGQTFSSSEVADPQVAEDDSGIRNPGMMTAATDAKGTVYIVWSDCRFNSGCNANGLVMSSSTDCINWTPPSQISTTGDLASVDHILPGVGADQGSSAAGGRVGVVYYYFNNSQCNPDCELGVAYVGTKDGGKTWSHPAALGSPFSINWLPNSDLGPMLGDYFAVAFSNGRAFPIVPIALQPDGDTLNQLMYTAQGGIPF